jgi:hypothetical protein
MRLHRQFVSGEMISFAMGNRGGEVSVARKVMELGDSFVGALWHGILLTSLMLKLGYEIRKRRHFVPGR